MSFLYCLVCYLLCKLKQINDLSLVGKEREIFFCSKEFPLPLGAWGRLRYFIVAP